MPIIGIDLGTTNSLAAVWRGGESVLIPNSLGGYITPSVVSVGDDGGILTGETAKQRLISHPDRTMSLFKQFMGSPKVYKLGGHTFKPEDLSAMILRSLKNNAEAFLGEKVTEAIISVPAYFNDMQRSATKVAGQLAGLKVERILNEPSAAALAYRRFDVHDGTNMIFDFGGGTLDISVLEAFDNIVDILAVSGDNHLGGSDVDSAIMEAFLRENPSLEPVLSEQQKGILLKNAEACKISVTEKPQAFMVFRHNEKDYTMVLDNEKLMQICSPILLRFKDVIKRALQNAERTLPLLDNIILVGGSCRMPLVREYLRHLTNKSVLCDIDPDFVVALGVGVATGIKERNEEIRDMVLTDICPFSLGVATNKNGRDNIFSPIIPRNCALPVSRVHRYVTMHDNQTEVTFEIYQGESIEASKNLLLGKQTVNVPPLPQGDAAVNVRFTYDINGILDVEFNCEQTGQTYRKLIVGNNRLSDDEVNARLKELSKLKTPPRELDENKLLIARGQRLYEEFSGSIQQQIEEMLLSFENELDKSANSAKTAQKRSRLEAFFNRLDAYSENLLLFGYAEYEDDEDYDGEDEDYDDNDEPEDI